MTADKNKKTDEGQDEFAGYTPAMRQFLQIKRDNPNLLLLYRMGDFYETFFEDAELVHRILGLTLTSRSNSGNGAPIPMAGVPYASVDQYLVRLVNQGISVGVCEQLGVPGKGLMERKLSRIITPGTLTDENLLSERAESSLLAVNPSRKGAKIGLAWLVLSSGTFKTKEIASDELLNEISRISPSEILIPDRYRAEAENLGLTQTATALPDWHFDAVRAEKTIKDQFSVSTLEPFGIQDHELLISAAGVVLEYALQTQGTELPHVTSLVLETDNQHVNLDAATRRNLEIVSSLRGNQSNTLFSVVDHCRTSMGSRRLLSWLNSPVRSQETAKGRSDTVEVIAGSISNLEAFSEILKGIPDFERTASRIALATVKPRDLAALRDSLPAIQRLHALTLRLATPLAEELAGKLPIPSELHGLLCRALLPEPNSHLRDGDVIAQGYSEELDRLRELRDHSGKFLVDLEQREKQKTGITTLRVEYNSVHGYFIEVSKGQADKVPPEYRRRQTLKNVERFITPELKEFEDKAISAQERSKALEKELYDDLIAKCLPYCPGLLASAEAVSTLDCLYSLASHANDCRWVKPEFSDAAAIDIKGARHPVVEKTIESYIPNDCELNSRRRLLIITGPNMGGKSTYMRSIALIVLLAYTGSFVPADRAVIGPVDKILTRIGAADDLAKGLSTFMVEMTESAAIIRNATEQSLVLMDEVGRGTSTFDGLSLAGAIAEDLAINRRSMTLFATHYFELTQLEKVLGNVANVHVSATQTSRGIVFLHEIKEGPANQSYGIAVAKLAGIPRNIIKGAQKLLFKLEERAAKSDDPQLDLFLDTPNIPTEEEEETTAESADDVLARQVLELNLDDLSPRQAWEALGELQKTAASLKKD